MHSPALGLAYHFLRRGRPGLLAVAGYFVFLLLFQRLVPMGERKDDDAILLMLPCFAGAIYLVSLFAYGDADLGARESCVPRHMMTLPAGNWALVGWPMLLATSAVALLWVLLAHLLLIPCGIPVPTVWPATMLAALMAAAQTAALWPFGLRYARLVALLLGVTLLAAVANYYASIRAPHWLFTTSYLAVLAVCYPLAVLGLTLARRGDGTVWRGLSLPAWLSLDTLRRRRSPFPSPHAAQLWLEFFRNSWIVPAQVFLITLCLWLLTLKLAHSLRPIRLAYNDQLVELNHFAFLSCIALAQPLLMAFFMGNQLAKSDAWSKQLAVLPFIAVRPLSSTDLVAAKFRAAFRVALLCHAIVIPSVVAWAWLLPEPARRFFTPLFPAGLTFKGAAAMLFLALLLIAATWKAQATSLWLILSGRRWLNWGFFAGSLLALMLANVAGALLYRHPDALAAVTRFFRTYYPHLLVTLALLKLALSLYTAHALHQRALVPPARLRRWTAVWLVTFTLLVTVSWWLLPPNHVPLPTLLAAGVLLTPFARLALAPLMLHWNRHR